MGRQYLAPDATNQEVFFAPVKLEGFSQLEFERHVGSDYRASPFDSPAPDEFGYALK